MNPNPTDPTAKRPLVIRALPYFIVAAIIINTGLLMIPADFVMIAMTSLFDLFGIDANTMSDRAYYTAGSLPRIIRDFGNITLIVGFLVVVFRGLQEK